MKKLKAWIEIYKDGVDTPSVMLQKPLKREVKYANDFGYKIYECEIKIGKELKIIYEIQLKRKMGN